MLVLQRNAMSNITRQGRQGPDVIGCAALLLLGLFAILGMRAMVVNSSAAAPTPQPTISINLAAAATAPVPTALQPATTLFPPPPSPTTIPTPWPTPIVASPPPAPTPILSEMGQILAHVISPTPTPLPQPTPTGFLPAVQVPILMYHYISVPPEDADIYRTDLSVTPQQFRAQMQYLVDNGYTALDLYELGLAVAGKMALPPRPVIITVDDGYVDNYLYAFPILQELGLKATFFIITEFVDQGYAAYMSWPMIETMAAAGMRMEPHTKTHLNLDGQERDFVVYQILGSQQTMAAHIGYTPSYFAYPGGRYDAQTIEVLRELDFWGAVTTSGGKWHSFEGRYEWQRLRIRNTTTLPEFADLVSLDTFP